MSGTQVNNTLSESEESDVISDDQDSEYETDIELDPGGSEEFDPSGKTRYLQKCDELGKFPLRSHALNFYICFYGGGGLGFY
jgi:hypothetical protein